MLSRLQDKCDRRSGTTTAVKLRRCSAATASGIMALVEQENELPVIDEQQLPVPRPNDGTNVSSEGGDGSDDDDAGLVQIGGEIATPAFALLDGVVYDVSQYHVEVSSCSKSKTVVTTCYIRSSQRAHSSSFVLRTNSTKVKMLSSNR